MEFTPPVIGTNTFTKAPLMFNYADGREVRQIGSYAFVGVYSPDGACQGANLLGPARVYATCLRPYIPAVLAKQPIRAIPGLEVRK